MEDWGKAVYSEIVEHEGKTKLISRAQYTSAEDLKKVLDMGMIEGLTQIWDRLAVHLQQIR